MVFKSGIFVLFCCSTFSVTSATPADDADAAFQDFISFSTEILNTKYNETKALEADAHLKLDQMQQEALDTLARKILEVKSAIEQIEYSFSSLSIFDSCGYPSVQIDNFQANITRRTLQCTELSKKIISNMLAVAWNDFTTQENDYMGCVGRSLDQCHAYATDDRCFEYMTNSIQFKRFDLQSAFERIDFNFRNKVASFQMPCQKLIDFEIGTYPDFYLPYMNRCAENVIKQTRRETCAN